jgi:hypothetical protein
MLISKIYLSGLVKSFVTLIGHIDISLAGYFIRAMDT